MIRIEKTCLLLSCLAMFGCGGMSSPRTTTGSWRAVMTSTAAQQGQQGEQAILLVSLQQNGKVLNATVNSVAQESSCFSASAVMGTSLKGQVILPGGEAIANLQLSGSLGSGAGSGTTLNMTGAMQSEANNAAGTFKLDPAPSGCPNSFGTFELTRVSMP